MEQSWKRPFFTIYIGQAFSLLSSNAVQFAIIWWITIETGSAIALTIATVCGLLPQIIIGPFAGVWIDRYNRKTILILADCAVAASSFTLGAAFFFGTPSLLFVYIILSVRALGETFHKPAMKAAIPQLVPKSELTKAGGLGQMIISASNMTGPMLGALLMSITTLPYVMLADIIGAALAVLTLSSVRISKPEMAAEKPKVLADMKQAFQVIKSNKALIRVSAPVFLTSIVFLPLGALLPLVVREYFLGGAWHNGIVKMLFSSGMLTAALVIGITGGLKSQFLMISLSSLLLGTCSLIGGILPPSSFWLFCLVVFIMGTTGMCGNIPYIAFIQKTVPQESLGKVLSLVTSAMSLGIPMGMIIAGPVAEKIGVNNWMVAAGILMLLVGTLSYFMTREYDMLPNSPGLAPYKV